MVVSSSSIGYRYLPESEIGMRPGYQQLVPLLERLVQLVGKSGGEGILTDDDNEGMHGYNVYYASELHVHT